MSFFLANSSHKAFKTNFIVENSENNSFLFFLFLIFQGISHEINLVALRSLKSLQSNSKVIFSVLKNNCNYLYDGF